jgi:NDP-sugar pyrophosphorylase family protein
MQQVISRVILLATGEGGSVSPLTGARPSAMIPLFDRPLMVYQIELLARQGIRELFVSLYHLPEKIEAYFGTGERWGLRLNYILQRQPFGSAGALGWARRWLDQTFLVMPADSLIDLNLKDVLQQHKARNSAATVVVQQNNAYGSRQVCLDGRGRVTAAGQEAAGSGVCDTGVYVFEPQIFDHIPVRVTLDIHHDLLPALLQHGLPVSSYVHKGYWNPIETVRDLQNAAVSFSRAVAPRVEGADLTRPAGFRTLRERQISPGVWAGKNTQIHPEAILHPPIRLGDNSRVGAGVELGPDAFVGSNVIVDDNATVIHSMVLDGTYVGRFVRVENRLVDKGLVVDIETGQSTQVVDQYLLGETYRNLSGRVLVRWFDVMAAVGLLLAASPVMLAVGLLLLLLYGRVFQSIEMTWGNPGGLISQEPHNKSSFQLLRFFTAGGKGTFSRLLERLELDRLPELLNVIKGDMSMVGAKPLAVGAEPAGEAWFEKIYELRPGFTGAWYVYTRRESDLDEVLIADAYYAVTRSFRRDVKLLLLTPAAWLNRLRGPGGAPVLEPVQRGRE